jgi:metal-responsive CopG/Arc/MetJ family transcriptional regulator
MTYIPHNIYVMKRTTVFLDDKLLREAQRYARRTGTSFATVVREALARYLAQPNAGSLPSIAGRFSSGTKDTASRTDEILWRNPHE